MAAAVESFGRLDIVVTNAGIIRDAVLWKMSDEDFDAVIDVHLRGTFTTVREAVRHMRGAGHGGRIICIGSPTGQRGTFGQTNYAAAKAGIVGMVRTWALELQRAGITANAVMPGGVRTAHRRDPHGTADYDGAVRWKTAAQGAATPVLVATAPELTGIGGRYFEDCAIAEENVPGSRTGYARHAVDPETAQRLWDASADLVR